MTGDLLEIFVDDPRVVMCGGGGTGSIPATAVRQPDGGFRVTGESTFISGCWNSEWCFMPAPEVEEGQDIRHADFSTMRMRFMHRSEWEIVETWDVAGIRGSGSDNVRAEGARQTRPKLRPHHEAVRNRRRLGGHLGHVQPRQGIGRRLALERPKLVGVR